LIASQVFEFDLLLSLPVAKRHMHTGVTLGIKNLKGCLYRREKVRYHQLEYDPQNVYPEKTLDTAITDLATVLLPDLTVVDGYIGMEGLGPSGGDSVCSDFAVASFHPLGADVAACKMMGISAEAIPHLRVISERLSLPIGVDDYSIIPEGYCDNIISYKSPPEDIAITYPDVKLCDRDSCSACLSTVMFFLKRFKTDMGQYLDDDGILRIAIGKKVEESFITDKTILVGNCARSKSGKGVFVAGCPPVPTRIYQKVTGDEPEENEPELSS
jgi:hypothetical protein